MKPTTAFRKMIKMMMKVSKSSCRSPVRKASTAEMAAAAISSSTIRSVNWDRNSLNRLSLPFCRRALGPAFCSRPAAASRLRPLRSLPSSSRVWSALRL